MILFASVQNAMLRKTPYATLQGVRDLEHLVDETIVVPEKDYPVVSKGGIKQFQKTDDEVDMDLSIGLRPMMETYVDPTDKDVSNAHVHYMLARGSEATFKEKSAWDDSVAPPRSLETTYDVSDAAVYDSAKKRANMMRQDYGNTEVWIDKQETAIPTALPIGPTTEPRLIDRSTSRAVEQFIGSLSYEPVRIDKQMMSEERYDDYIATGFVEKTVVEKLRPTFQDGLYDPMVPIGSQETVTVPNASRVVVDDDVIEKLARFEIASVSPNVLTRTQFTDYLVRESNPKRVGLPSIGVPYKSASDRPEAPIAADARFGSFSHYGDRHQDFVTTKLITALPEHENILPVPNAGYEDPEPGYRKPIGALPR